ncbi:MAG: hypothetical protein PHR25_06605 [Clostridia bacterium]|nr:hypothetical protein [Clostridia bacterium]MDD4376425.1 hypothetical protein [Clostridia bacterium]
MSIQDNNSKKNKNLYNNLYNTNYEDLRSKMYYIANSIQSCADSLNLVDNTNYLNNILQYKTNLAFELLNCICQNVLFTSNIYKNIYSSIFDNISNILDANNYITNFSDTITTNLTLINTSLSGIRELLNDYETNYYFKKVYSNIINIKKDLFYDANEKIGIEIQEDGSIIIDDIKYEKNEVEEIIKDVSSNFKVKKDNNLYKRTEQWYIDNQFKVFMVGGLITIFTTVFGFCTWIFEPEYNNIRDAIREKIGIEVIEEHKDLLNTMQDMYTQIVDNQDKIDEKVDNIDEKLKEFNNIKKNE